MTSLNRVLRFDAATCAAMGLALALAGGPLAPLLGLPADLLWAAGLALLPVAGFMAWVAARPSALGVWIVVAGNVAWVAGSLALLAWVSPTPLGLAFVLGQAGAVAVLAALELAALRAAPGAA